MDQLVLVFCADTRGGRGAAGYSPAKYGIVTEMRPPELLVKGNSWIEGLTVLSIIFGTVLGGVLISPSVSDAVLSHAWLPAFVQTRTEGAILIIRSEERRVGKAGVSRCRSRWPRYHKKKKM